MVTTPVYACLCLRSPASMGVDAHLPFFGLYLGEFVRFDLAAFNVLLVTDLDVAALSCVTQFK